MRKRISYNRRRRIIPYEIKEAIEKLKEKLIEMGFNIDYENYEPFIEMYKIGASTDKVWVTIDIHTDELNRGRCDISMNKKVYNTKIANNILDVHLMVGPLEIDEVPKFIEQFKSATDKII